MKKHEYVSLNTARTSAANGIYCETVPIYNMRGEAAEASAYVVNNIFIQTHTVVVNIMCVTAHMFSGWCVDAKNRLVSLYIYIIR